MTASAARTGTRIVAVCVALLAWAGWGSRSTLGQPTLPAGPVPPDVASEASQDPASQGSLQDLITAIAREHLPDKFESRDDWGDTTEVWAGLDVRLDGLQVKTKRRKKQVNHGTWKLYRIRLVEPDKYLHVEVQNVHSLPNGRIEFDLLADAKLDVFARLSQWEFGVQLISLSVNAAARTQFRVHCDLGLKLDAGKLPPDVLLDPMVSQAEVRLVDFRVRRISQVGGSLAHELGKQARDLLDKELAKQNEKLSSKINRQIDKNRDKLRLSFQDLLTSQWGELAAKQLGMGDGQGTGTSQGK